MLSKKKAKDLWNEWVNAEAEIHITKSKGTISSATKIVGDMIMVDTLFASLAERMMTNKIHTRDELVRLIDNAIKAKEMSNNESK
jgi:hypothetical protein